MEQPEAPRTSLSSSNLYRFAGMAAFIIGAIFIAVGLIRYFAYAPNDERQLAIINCTIEEVRDEKDGLEVTFKYEYQGTEYSNEERNEAFRELGFRKGQVLGLWVIRRIQKRSSCRYSSR